MVESSRGNTTAEHPTEMGAPTILVVDDDVLVLRAIRRMLSTQGYEVLSAATGPEAVQLAKANEIDVALIDMVLGDVDGVAVLKTIKSLHPLGGMPHRDGRLGREGGAP